MRLEVSETMKKSWEEYGKKRRELEYKLLTDEMQWSKGYVDSIIEGRPDLAKRYGIVPEYTTPTRNSQWWEDFNI